jgi:hypothetical protein
MISLYSHEGRGGTTMMDHVPVKPSRGEECSCQETQMRGAMMKQISIIYPMARILNLMLIRMSVVALVL